MLETFFVLYLSTAAADGTATYLCLRADACEELNPLLRPLSPTPLVAVKAGLTTGAAIGLWKLRKRHPKITIVVTGLLVGMQVTSTIRAVRSTREPR